MKKIPSKFIKENIFYQITSFGSVINGLTDKEIPQYIKADGYSYVKLYVNSQRKEFRVDRLVAETFLSKPAGINPQRLTVDHKDGNKQNNCEFNLKWRIISTPSRTPIKIQMMNDKRIIETEFDSFDQAAIYIKALKGLDTKFEHIKTNIIRACKAKHLTAYGYHWKVV